MSFGFSPTDLVTLISLTTRAYHGWRDACGQYGEITSTLFSLQVVLERVHRHAKSPTDVNALPFLVDRNKLRDDLQDVLGSSDRTVRELRTIVQKYRNLDTDQKSNWDRIRLGCKNRDSLQIRLSLNLSFISTLLMDQVLQSIDMCCQDVSKISSAIQGGLPVALENLVESSSADSRTANTAFTTYEHDSKEVWRELRREMISLGFKSDDIAANKEALLDIARVVAGEGNNVDIDEDATETVYEPTPEMPEQVMANADINGTLESNPSTTAKPLATLAAPHATSDAELLPQPHSSHRTHHGLRRKTNFEEIRAPDSRSGPSPLSSLWQHSRPASDFRPNTASAQSSATSKRYPPSQENGVSSLESLHPSTDRQSPSFENDKESIPAQKDKRAFNASSFIPDRKPNMSRKRSRVSSVADPYSQDDKKPHPHSNDDINPNPPNMPTGLQKYITYYPMSVYERKPAYIHLLLPLGWIIHVRPKTLQISFQDLLAKNDEPMYFTLPPRVWPEEIIQVEGWRTYYSTHGRVSWTTIRTDAHGFESLYTRYTHPSVPNEDPQYRCLTKEWMNTNQDIKHGLNESVQCFRVDGSFFVDYTIENPCQVLVWTREMDDANPGLVAELRAWAALKQT
ncbi:hypothetical protein BCR34DRAFT_567367 [Clohesyomyces aquaticus]|uniref:Fungal N-terminal domain-containing protein n=1 Tax=Clohesyomyces aquaticus TaxID=1231657 RepID=A0A1Y1ZIS6_9PLEO|nr:hypothetical protein BCR34DRAFT_567367 [Clohesyomyces aquaticus]